jgi:hypothetical protein
VDDALVFFEFYLTYISLWYMLGKI